MNDTISTAAAPPRTMGLFGASLLPVNGMIDLDTIRSFRVTLEDAFVQNSIFAPQPDAQDPGADTSARLYADAYSGSTQLLNTMPMSRYSTTL